MLTLLWLRGLVRRRPARLLGAIAGIAIAVSLMTSIGTFLAGSTAAMTDRAIAGVPLDWQVQAATGQSARRLAPRVAAFPGVRSALPFAYARIGGFSATANGATSSAGAGLVLGMPAGYRSSYPGEISQYIGARHGVLIAQQMAANLAVGVGDTVAIPRPGAPPAHVVIDGIIDFPAAQQLLAPVAAAPSGSAAPPPDNVLVLPLPAWHRLFDSMAARRPDLVFQQVHAELQHDALPRDPSAAYTHVLGLAKSLEARLQGSGTVGDNLASALDKARGDSLYARVAFLFLGLPGALLAGFLTITLATAGGDRRRREQALLRVRGATVGALIRLALAETALVGVLGGLAGLGVALVIGRLSFGSSSFGAGPSSTITWSVAALVSGLIVAAGAIALPAWRDARRLTVTAARATIGRPCAPWWCRYGLDLLALAAALAVFYATGSNGYQLVLAAEGTTQVSVDYWSFAAPLLAWIGIGLLCYRLAELVLRRGTRLLARGATPIAGELAGTVAVSMGRERRLLARALTLTALATTFTVSTAAFNSTYHQQAEVDARLSNGADVVVTLPPTASPRPGLARTLSGIPGVASVEPLQHRYAYIGNDLQDVFGVRASTVGAGAQLTDAYFTGGSASSLLARLQRTPDGVLLSQEVVHDYQLHPGQRIVLRLVDRRTRAPRPVRFTYIGVTNEFPTAPKDAYTVVNASYVARMTHDPAVGSFLIQTRGASPAAVARAVATRIPGTASVTDINTNRKLIAGSLTSVELAGLTRIELGYALVLVAAATGLLLVLGLAERRRTFAIAHALGARPRQLAGFIWSETAFVTLGGLLLGGVAATGLTWMLVKLLTGVFDPPPRSPAVPWSYLVVLLGVTAAAVTVAVLTAQRSLRRPALESLRDL